jgi:hypothetical protein
MFIKHIQNVFNALFFKEIQKLEIFSELYILMSLYFIIINLFQISLISNYTIIKAFRVLKININITPLIRSPLLISIFVKKN